MARALDHQRAGRVDRAMVLYRRVLAADPGIPQAHNNLGLCLKDLRRYEQAVAAFDRALALDPQAVDPHNNRGLALLDLNRVAEAAAAFRRAHRLRPAGPAAANLAMLLTGLGEAAHRDWRLAEAEAAFSELTVLRTTDAVAWDRLGVALYDARRLDPALAAFDRALSLESGHAKARYHRALARLLRGDLPAAWDDYEYRFAAQGRGEPGGRLGLPRWRGEALAGRTLLVVAEQGLGDSLQFVRFLPALAEREIRTVLRVPPSLVRLLRRLPGPVAVIAEGTPPPPCDAYVPLLSLPGCLGVGLADLPVSPYLRPDPAAVARWRDRLVLPPGPRLGLVWRGNPHMPCDSRRSIGLDRLGFLEGWPDLRLVSLQRTPPPGENGPALHDPMGLVHDFDDTAAVIACVDRVLCVDTAVAHLAAAMGKPVWLLCRFDGCWRWLEQRQGSPWYPSLRLFRQPAPGDWDTPLRQVEAAIAEWLRRPPCSLPFHPSRVGRAGGD